MFMWKYETMVHLDLACNFFTGTIPGGVSQTEPHLSNLFVNNNNLSGTIPRDFGLLGWSRLHMQTNEFHGTVPSDIYGGKTQALMLHNNKLSGTFPATDFVINYSGHRSQLSVLTLYDNDITGDLEDFCQLWLTGNLETLEVDMDKVLCSCCTAASDRYKTDCGSVAFDNPYPNPISEPIVDDATPTVDEEISMSSGTCLQSTSTKPFYGITTLFMDPYVSTDCYFGDNAFPHVFKQCECFHKIVELPDDTKQLYQQVRSYISEHLYHGLYDEDPNSCTPTNQAMIWLSSGDNRDAGNLVQRLLLAVLFIETKGPEWQLIGRGSNLWLSEHSECMWLGIQCDENFLVSEINLSANNVQSKGTPPALNHLCSIRHLDLSGNKLMGSLHAEMFYMLTNLESLNLDKSNLKGTIPQAIQNLQNLVDLQLDHNMLDGSLPGGFGVSLTSLKVDGNRLKGSIPSNIGSLSKLQTLSLSNNLLSGNLPNLSQLSHLKELDLSHNALLDGTLPSWIGSLTGLTNLNLSWNAYFGPIPSDIWLLVNLNRLSLDHNRFSGRIPEEYIGNLQDLDLLYLNSNHFSGTLPDDMGNMNSLYFLDVGNNILSGSLPSSFGQLTNLQLLTLEGNALLAGTVPKEVCELRNNMLDRFVVDCPMNKRVGFICPEPTCCSFCRITTRVGV